MREDNSLTVTMHSESPCVLFAHLLYVFFSHIADYVSVFGIVGTIVLLQIHALH